MKRRDFLRSLAAGTVGALFFRGLHSALECPESVVDLEKWTHAWHVVFVNRDGTRTSPCVLGWSDFATINGDDCDTIEI